MLLFVQYKILPLCSKLGRKPKEAKTAHWAFFKKTGLNQLS